MLFVSCVYHVSVFLTFVVCIVLFVESLADV